jgi:hypothetical protein
MSYRRKQEEKKRLKKLYAKTRNGYLCGAWYHDDKGRYIRYYKSDYSAYKFLKKCFHKKLRHSETVSNKEYDLMWKTF